MHIQTELVFRKYSSSFFVFIAIRRQKPGGGELKSTQK